MGKLFGIDSGLYKVLSRLADIVILNLLFLLCSLPILTIGASLSAKYSVALKIVRGRDCGVVKPFFRAFKESFLKATALWFIYLVFGALVYFGIRVVDLNGLPWFFKLVYGVVTILLAFTMTWTWAMEAQFSNPVFRTIRNSLIVAFVHPIRTIAAIALNLIPLGILALFGGNLFAQLSFIWFLFGFSGTAILNSYLFRKVFDGFIEREEKKDCEENEEDKENNRSKEN